MASVSLVNLCKSFGEIQAVQNLNLEINDGEFVTLLGPSGCGKSTTLYCIAGLEEPTSGEILFDGQTVNTLSPRDRDVAMVFQDYALYPHKTVFENLAFPLRMRGIGRDIVRSKVPEVATLLSIETLLERRPAQLSGGQRQRVALGRAIVREPVVFLLDEPLSNLDAALRVSTRVEIKGLQRQLGATMVYVTHDQEEAMVLSDRIAVMRDGLLHQYDSPTQIYEAPANAFVAGFVGSPAMNFIEGSIELVEGGLHFVSGELVIGLTPEKMPLNNRRALGARPVVLGVRPGSLLVSREASPGAVPGEILLVEPVGEVTFAQLKLEDVVLRASTDPDLNLHAGSQVWASMAQHKVYLFDPETGDRL